MSLPTIETPSTPDDECLSLTPARQRPRTTWFSHKQSAYVGIDIGEQAVRIATLREIHHSGGEFAWTDRYQFSLPTKLDQELSPEWLRSVMAVIPERLPRCIEGENNLVAIALPIAWTHYQTIAGHELAQSRLRCSEMFAQSIFQSPAHLCHWPVVGLHHGKPCIDDQYVIAATAERTVCQIADLVAACGYNVQSVLPHGVALAHAARALTGVDAQCVLWLNHGSALIAVRHKTGVGLTRTLPSVPNRILRLVTADRPLDAHTLRPYLTEIATEFRATARYAAHADMSRVSKKPILIAGPIAEIDGVDETIATLTNTPVALWSYIGRNRPATLSKLANRDENFVRRLDSSFAGALSLAMAAARGSSKGYGQ
ncbi:MAG: hypothetical protein KDB00_26540 [Planctomycetales bacterium]|nr:hypothetical protein [Planctomycetales bacterium]